MNKNIIGVYMVTSLAMAGVFTISPALPAIGDALNIDNAEIGYLITSFTLGTILVAPFMGLIADQYGRKKLLIPSLYIFGFAGIFCGLVKSFEWLLFWRFFQGVGSAALGTLSATMISDMFSGPDRVRYFGYNMVVNSAGMIAFPLIGGLLVVYDWRYPFFVSALAIPFAIYNQFFLRYEENLTDLNIKSYLLGFVGSLKDRRILLAGYLNFSSFAMLGGAFLTYYAVYFSEYFPQKIMLIGIQWEREIITGFAMSLFSLMVGVVSSRLGFFHSTFGFNRVIAVAYLSYAGALYLFQATDNLLVVLVAAAWLGVGHGLAAPSLIALHAKLAPEGMTAAYLTLNSLIFRLGQTIGPIATAAIYYFYDLNSVFVFSALVALPAVLVAFLTQWRTSEKANI